MARDMAASKGKPDCRPGRWTGRQPACARSRVRSGVCEQLRLRDQLLGIDEAGQAHAHQPVARARRQARSEEHTSELQSLMRISYAVFCLKKNTTNATTD